MRYNEVFSPGGFPAYTYNPRSKLELEAQFKDYLDTGYKLLSLSGPTKSGKTVLCKQMVPPEQAIYISGGNIREENDFWEAINANLCLFTDVTTGKSEEKGIAKTVEVTGEMNALIANAGTSVANTETKTLNQSRQLSRSENPRSVAIKGLLEEKKPVIVDDFHYISEQIQTNIVRSLKNPIFEGLRLILISVPHRAYDPVKVETEMTGRVQQLKIPLWREDELMEISSKGFPLLNILISQKTAKIMAKECFGNPQLMQEYCAKLCKLNNISVTAPIPTAITNDINDDFFSTIANAISSKADYEKMERGPRQRSDRIKRIFVDGQQGDIYKAILVGLANTGPKTEVQYEELRSELRSVLKGDLPQKGQVTPVLTQMQKISSSAEGKPLILEYDNKSAMIYILDPYFAFYLRWAIRNKSIKKPTNGNFNTHETT